MENLISIPYTSGEIDDPSKVSIDMSNLKFDCPDNKKKFYAFIFIRNTGIKSILNFDKCSFEDKEEYLNMFLTLNIEIKCPILASTWIEILSFNNNENIYLPCILDKAEIIKFRERNKNLLDNIYQFINSLPLYSIFSFTNEYDFGININEFECSNDNNIKLVNFYQLTEFDRFILLLNANPSYEHRPVLYEDLFNDRENSYDFNRIMKNLPYINFLNAIFSNNQCQDDIVSEINNLFKQEEEKCQD